MRPGRTRILRYAAAAIRNMVVQIACTSISSKSGIVWLATFNIASALGGNNPWELSSKGYLSKIKLLYSGTETTATAVGEPADAAWFTGAEA